MKVAIFAGGRGLRLMPDTSFVPKPMVEIGGYPILWHIMKHYSTFGHSDFVIALGYLGDVIKKYIADYRLFNGNLRVDFANGNLMKEPTDLQWRVDLIETGAEAQTGARLRRLAPHLGDGTFMLTYGDGVANVDLNKLLDFHRAHGRLATLTVVHPPARFGQIQFAPDSDQVAHFREKSQLDVGWINGGYFVLEPEVLEYIGDGEHISFEKVVLERLAEEGELVAYRHNSFWQCMDSPRDREMLEKLWSDGDPPWKVWPAWTPANVCNESLHSHVSGRTNGKINRGIDTVVSGAVNSAINTAVNGAVNGASSGTGKGV